MDESILALSKYRMQKAADDLNSSEVLLNEKYYAQSINRSYYAIFHAVRAILAFDKFDSKKHSGIIESTPKSPKRVKTRLGKFVFSLLSPR
ncbi:MAG: HEPN domain-containing protein [Bacteroidetes bacterium]|nr:HEPN domain-containing protein [Bacteroidota bacterium]